MKSLLVTAVASGILASASGQVVPARQVRVHLYNLSGVSSGNLARATSEASNIFAKVSVEIVWELGSPDAEEAHTTDQTGTAFTKIHGRPVRSYFIVRVGSGMAGHTPVRALGVSLPDAQFGVSATIFEDRIESLCRSAGFDLVVVLGHAIAHELGHVLLGSADHAHDGIMQARWGRADLEQAAMGHLGFTALQGASIRGFVSPLLVSEIVR